MAGVKLHRYDRDLCDYVAGNVSEHIGVKKFRRRLKEETTAEMFEYLTNPDSERLLWTSAELEGAAESIYDCHEFRFQWRACEPLHERYIYTLQEVRRELSKQTAEAWSRDCVRFAKRLERPGLSLWEGIEIVAGWVGKLRRLLRAMEAVEFLPYPEGRQPTPTDPDPPISVQPPRGRPREGTAIERMLEAIQSLPGGQTAKAKQVIKQAAINRNAGLKALAELKKQGKYRGPQ